MTAADPLPDDPVVSVITPARNASATLTQAVRSALDQRVDEVVIAVAPSEDDTAQVAKRLAELDDRVRVVSNTGGSTPAGLQRALEASRGDVVVRVDAHSQLPPGYVDHAIQTLRRTGAGNVGGKQVPVGDTWFSRAVAAAMRSAAGSGGASYRSGDTPGPVETVYLGVYRRDALEKVGGFHEGMIRNQDYELNERLRRSGFAVWLEPSLEVRYRPRSTVSGLARQYYEYGRWRRVTARLHPGSLRPRQLAAPVLVVALLLCVLFSALLWTWTPVAVAGSAYLSTLTITASVEVRPLGLVPGAVVALVVMHMSWGVGFLVGPPASAAALPEREVR